MEENLQSLMEQNETQKSQLLTLVKWANEQEEFNDKTNKELVSQKEEIDTIKGEIVDIKDNEEINRSQRARLRKHGARRIAIILPIKKDYTIYAHTFFGHMWHDYKKQFDVASYTETRRKDYQAGLDFIDAWSPDDIAELKAEIDETNRIKEQDRLKNIFAARDSMQAKG